MLAVVLSGGGASCAYEVGALQYLLGEKGIDPELYCGTSVGAINAAFLAQYPNGKQRMAISDLSLLWSKIDTPKIYKKWYGGLLWYLPALWKESIYDASPARQLIRTHLDEEKLMFTDKNLRVIGVSLNTGERQIWDERSRDLVAGVMASSSCPILFPPVQMKGNLFSDGGLRNLTPLGTAVKLGATEIYVVTCIPKVITYKRNLKFNIFSQISRFIEILCHELQEDDLKKTELYNRISEIDKHSGKRFVQITTIQPKEDLGDSMDFSPQKNQKLMELGYTDAQYVCTVCS